MIKLAIIGSREFNDYELFKKELEPYKNKISLIISGGARGADKLAERYADEFNIPKLIFLADWDKYGKGAGFIRNFKIIESCDCVIAFWDGKSKGTKHSLIIANEKNKPIKIINYGIK